MFRRASNNSPSLAVTWNPDNISLLLFSPSGNSKYETFAVSQSDIASKIKEFFGKCVPAESILIIPRSEVLQKEMAFTRAESQRADIESQLTQLLPYAAKEMAYSIALDSTSEAQPSKGLLYAIPQEKIRKILALLEGLGISIDEVVSEDQALFWLFRDKAVPGPVLVFDQDSERTLFLALKENSILLSRTYPYEEPLKNVLSEVSFSLLESGVKPVRAFVSERISEEVSGVLGLPVESFKAEAFEGKYVSSALSGAKARGALPPISLLPNERKIQKRGQRQNRLLKEGLAVFGLFIICFTLFSASHLFILKSKKAMLENESRKIAPAVAEVRQMSASLDAVHEAERSKERLLSLLREFARRVPSSIRLKELQIEGRSIVFQGESSSHALLTETVQVFEKIEGVKEAKLEHARLRKRLNQDFFDFEVTARWQD